MPEPADWPTSWVGEWRAPDGKTVRIERRRRTLLVSVLPRADGPPYRKVLLDGTTREVDRLPAQAFTDDEDRLYLEIEAGTPGLGPTYRLYAAAEDDSGRGRAPVGLPAEQLVLVPSTGIGLYDDWEDDQGVPWAYPLEPMRRTSAR